MGQRIRDTRPGGKLFEKFGRRNVSDKLIMARLSDDAGTAAFQSMLTADQAALGLKTWNLQLNSARN